MTTVETAEGLLACMVNGIASDSERDAAAHALRIVSAARQAAEDRLAFCKEWQGLSAALGGATPEDLRGALDVLIEQAASKGRASFANGRQR